MRIPVLQTPLQHAPPQLHAGFPRLALNPFEALGSQRILLVLNANDLGEAVLNRIPATAAERSTG